jgi:ribosomal protein S27E
LTLLSEVVILLLTSSKGKTMGIKCPKCNFENPEDTLFCGKCATRLPSPEGIEVTKTLETPKEELTTGSPFACRYQIIEELGKGGLRLLKENKVINLVIGAQNFGFAADLKGNHIYGGWGK